MPPATRQPASPVPSLGLPGGELLAGSSPPEPGWGGPTASHQPEPTMHSCPFCDFFQWNSTEDQAVSRVLLGIEGRVLAIFRFF